MPVTVDEQPDKQVFGSTGRRQYYIRDATTMDEARTALLASADAPATWEAGGRTLYRDDDQCEAFEMGNQVWFGVAHYVDQEDATGGGGGDSLFSFDTTGATEHIIASLATDAFGPNTADADNDSLINVVIDDGAPKVEGVDITVGKLGFTVTKRFDVSAVTSAYIDTLAELTGTTNDDAITITTDDGIEVDALAGELLFFGATGGVRNGQVEIVFYFGKSPNVARTIGGIAFTAFGWDYVWVRYGPTKVAGLKVMGANALAVYVETVYSSADFDLLTL